MHRAARAPCRQLPLSSNVRPHKRQSFGVPMPSNTHFSPAIPNLSIPGATVIPVLEYPDVLAAADWLCRTFGFSERLRIGTHRVQLDIGEGAVVLAAGSDDLKRGFAGHSIMVRVSDVDRHYETAKAAGLQVHSEPVSYPYGERQYTAKDLAGHVWTFSESEANVDPSAWGGQLVASTARAA
jgi:uncharacterized glyoxalase superfamily protein PhnB